MRRPDLDSTSAFVLGMACALGVWLAFVSGAGLRETSSVLGIVVFGLLVWRLVSTWSELTVLEHALTVLLAASPLVATAAQAYLVAQAPDLPANPVLWLVVAHRAACLVLVVFWTRWLGRRTSPFRREPGVPSGA